MCIKIPKSEQRTFEQLKKHYEIEKELANKLRNANNKERRYLYGTLYDELFRKVPYLNQKIDSKTQAKKLSQQVRILKNFLNKECIFLEVGAGDCILAYEVAKFVKKVYAVDVAKVITKNSRRPQNFKLIISDGCSIPVPKNRINVAYSNHLMEHLHKDDVIKQLKNIYNALAPGGVYICITPNKLNGPHDISKYFDKIATGFHLKEYTNNELIKLLKTVGFKKVRVFVGGKGFFLLLPLSVFPIRYIEIVTSKLPQSLSRRASNWLPIRLFLGIKLVATK